MSTGLGLLLLAITVTVCMVVFWSFTLMDDTYETKRKGSSKDEIDQFFADLYTELDKDKD